MSGTESSPTVQYNENEIREFRNRYAGFFCIMTNIEMGSASILDVYRRKDVVENYFDDLKNVLDMRRLRVHSSEAMDSRLFIQFLALVLISELRKVLKADRELCYMSPREIMEAMECIVRFHYSSPSDHVFTEAGPLQRRIMDCFRLDT